MRTDKEYPATHSMSTAWYFVDEDDNVAIFSFDDNGPIPNTVDQDIWVNELCFEKPVSEEDDIKYLNLTDDQILNFVSDLWKTSIPDDYYWQDDIFLIDTDKKTDFLTYLKECRKEHGNAESWDNTFVPLCLSENLGIYIVDFNAYRYGDGLNNPFVKYLWVHHIIKKYCMTPDFDFGPHDLKGHCPYFLYENDWDPAYPHERISKPKNPVKLDQLPDELRTKAIRLNVKFSDTEKIQLANRFLCYSSCCQEEVSVDGATYVMAYLPSNEKIYVLNNDGNRNIEGLTLSLTEEQISKYRK